MSMLREGLMKNQGIKILMLLIS